MKRMMTVIALSALVAAGCKSQAQKDAEQAAENVKKAAEAVAKAAEQQGTAAAAKGANDMAAAMQGMAAAMAGAKTADGKPVDPIAFQTLQSHLPKVSGWEMNEPKGERMTMPVPFSSAETTYKKGEARMEVKIIDTGFAQLLMAPWSMMLASGYSRESSSGYEKATTFAGNPGIEKWNKSSKNGELDVLVNKRFMVTIEGHDVDDMKAVQDFASKIDFNAIGAAK